MWINRKRRLARRKRLREKKLSEIKKKEKRNKPNISLSKNYILTSELTRYFSSLLIFNEPLNMIVGCMWRGGVKVCCSKTFQVLQNIPEMVDFDPSGEDYSLSKWDSSSLLYLCYRRLVIIRISRSTYEVLKSIELKPLEFPFTPFRVLRLYDNVVACKTKDQKGTKFVLIEIETSSNKCLVTHEIDIGDFCNSITSIPSVPKLSLKHDNCIYFQTRRTSESIELFNFKKLKVQWEFKTDNTKLFSKNINFTFFINQRGEEILIICVPANNIESFCNRIQFFNTHSENRTVNHMKMVEMNDDSFNFSNVFCVRNEFLIYSGRDGEIYIHELSTPKCEKIFTKCIHEGTRGRHHHNTDLELIAFGQDNITLLSASADGEVCVNRIFGRGLLMKGVEERKDLEERILYLCDFEGKEKITKTCKTKSFKIVMKGNVFFSFHRVFFLI